MKEIVAFMPPLATTSLRLALYQPDIAQNTGTMLRLCACLGVAADIIEPAGFPVTDKHFRRSGMDYLDAVAITRHQSFDNFLEWRNVTRPQARLVLLTTKASQAYGDFAFQFDDILMVGRESAGVPRSVHEVCQARITIPMQLSLRSLNVAISAAMVLGEALRQVGGFPKSDLPAM